MSKIAIPPIAIEQKELTQEEKNLAMLRTFCAPGDSRYALNHPFMVSDFVYASDTHIIVRMQKSLVGDFERPEVDPPKIESVLSDDELQHADYSLPVAISADIVIECKNCKGSGEVSDPGSMRLCPKCGGDGIQECYSCGSERTCTACNGRGHFEGKKQCGVCRGSGCESAFMIDDVPFALHYARRVQDLFGQVEWGLSQNRERAMFRAGQVDGCYMKHYSARRK